MMKKEDKLQELQKLQEYISTLIVKFYDDSLSGIVDNVLTITTDNAEDLMNDKEICNKLFNITNELSDLMTEIKYGGK